MALNINRNVQDAFYRYKMPRLQAKVEGKGNGIKTVVVNMVAIATALDRPPTYVTKYFGCELGAQTQCDNPETVLKIKKNMIGASCKACGHIYTMDMRHK